MKITVKGQYSGKPKTSWGEHKKVRSVTLTDTAYNLLSQVARSERRSVSDLVEELARSLQDEVPANT